MARVTWGDVRLWVSVARDSRAEGYRRRFAAHELDRLVGLPLGLWIARRSPRWLRRWFVVQIANEAVREAIRDGRRDDGYAGPDGITFHDMACAADRVPVPQSEPAEPVLS